MTAEPFLDLHPATETMLDDVLNGFETTPRALPSKYFYDAAGSLLFDQICELDEYYPTKTERWILETYVDEISAALGDNIVLIEYGSGSSIKTRLLLEHLNGLAAYVPIDISKKHLMMAARNLEGEFPTLPIFPVCADYLQDIDLNLTGVLSKGDGHGASSVPTDDGATRSKEPSHLIFFPGSTIGNFNPEQARDFLKRVHHLAGNNGHLLIGVDLVKDPKVLHDAYNDTQGVTAEFNRNILHHVNHQLGADINVDLFEHRAFWDESAERIEMQLVATDHQKVDINGSVFAFNAGDVIQTEYSHKYRIEGFRALAEDAGFTVDRVWTDPQNLFSVQLLSTI
ncbi:MAG: L-histidine N(alpha)-methyltransferase [Bacteroidetes bacterium]|nr:L-histidine N(alpha)-methyltransferase [Bacteroidota bacterium]MDA1334068.1 L-histidine N(alpha)-methyltransferase [Bacteroidota bacterium]